MAGNFRALALMIMMSLGIAGSAASAKPKVGEPAPNFKATLFDGTKVQLSDFRGQVLLINIWATWCAPCRDELPLLDAYGAKTAKWGMRMLAITTEDSAPLSLLRKVQARLTIPMARHFSGDYDMVKNAVPTNFIIDRSGILRYAAPGTFDLDRLNATLIPLLQEPAPAAAAAGGSRAPMASR